MSGEERKLHTFEGQMEVLMEDVNTAGRVLFLGYSMQMAANYTANLKNTMPKISFPKFPQFPDGGGKWQLAFEGAGAGSIAILAEGVGVAEGVIGLGNGGFSGFPNMGSLGLGLKMMQDNQSSGGSDTQEENLLFGDKEPEDLIREGYSVKDLIKAGVKSKDIPLYNHIKKGEGVARGSKPGVKGAHNMDAFFESIEKDAKRLGLNTSDYNIEKTPHPTVKGLYEMKYVVPKKNGLGKPKYDANGVLKTRLAYDVKTVYDPKVFSDSDIYDMGRKALNPEISKISIGTREKIHGEINGIKFEGTVNIHGKLTTFYPIFD